MKKPVVHYWKYSCDDSKNVKDFLLCACGVFYGKGKAICGRAKRDKRRVTCLNCRRTKIYKGK